MKRGDRIDEATPNRELTSGVTDGSGLEARIWPATVKQEEWQSSAARHRQNPAYRSGDPQSPCSGLIAATRHAENAKPLDRLLCHNLDWIMDLGFLSKCRLCGGLTHLSDVTESFRVYTPIGMDHRMLIVTYAKCARCAYYGVHIPNDVVMTPDMMFQILTTTDSHSERNVAAIEIADFLPDHRAELITSLLVLIRDPKTRASRGTLIYVLQKLRAILKPCDIVDMLLDNVGEAFEETLLLLDDGLYELDEADIGRQILRIEAYLLAQRAAPTDPDKYQGMRDAHFTFVEKIAKPIQLAATAKFPFEPWPIAVLNVRIADLAKRFDYRLDSWEKDEIGPVHGWVMILPSGLWVILWQAKQQPGLYVEVGAEPIDTIDPLLNDVLAAFGLSSTAVQSKRLTMDDWT